MSGFMLGTLGGARGGAVAAKGDGNRDVRQLPTGSFGGVRDPLIRLYQQTGVLDDRPNRSDMTIGNSSKDYSFDEAHRSGGDYEVGEGPAVGSGYTEAGPTPGSRDVRQRQAPGDASKTDPNQYLRDEIERSKRDEMKINNDPTVQGVKTDKGKRRGGSGKSRGGKKGEGKGNYYEDKASGTGVHT